MSRKIDWALAQARDIYAVMQGGASKDVSINYLAATLRLASQKGAIEAAKADGAAKPKAEKETLV